ncbi:MAG: HD domain-containing protein, partial [Mycobacteriales bacterium]
SYAMPDRWPRGARDAFISLLGAGRSLIPVVEELDRGGALTRLIPEWEAVRSRPQRDPVHRFTVDRHLIETVANAAELMQQVARPDLLLLIALLHDIGKGSGRDHSVAGAEIVARVTARLGLPDADAAIVVAGVRHHLLLPDTATRRDLDDPATLDVVAPAIGYDGDLLDLLEALATADGLATGPAAWSPWKARLVRELAARVRFRLAGRSVRAAPLIDARHRALAAQHEVAVLVEPDPVAGHVVTVAAPDAIGLLSRAAGVLALHHLDVRSATVAAEHGSAVAVFGVEPRFGRSPEEERLQAELRRALAGQIPLGKRLAALDRTYADAPETPVKLPPPTVLWFDDEATDAVIVEIRTTNSGGLLYRLAGALESCAADIRAARVSTLGPAAVDAFYVVLPHAADPATVRERIETALETAASGRPAG